MSDTKVVNGTCHHDCPDSCGWQVTVSEGVAVKLRGNGDHPYSQGELCPKVNRMLDRVYSPQRLLTPLRRTGPKGAGEFEPTSWDDALATIAEQLHRVIDTHGGEAVLPYSSAGNQSLLSVMGLDSRFFHHLGATRLVRALCGPTVGAGVSMTNGTGRTLDPLELRHSKLIILWGTNTRLTNRHLWPTIEAARTDGAKVVVIDPLRTITADAADEFVQPLPGTDIALMLAMMHVLIRDDLTDEAWVAAHTSGFPELAEHVADWTPERAGAVCGLDPAQIVRLATDYGTTRPAAIRALIGAEHHHNGAMFYRSLAVLPALIGAWQYRGGGLSRSVGTYHDALIDDKALTRPDLLGDRQPRWLNMSRLGDILTDHSLDPPIHAIVVWNANPVVSVPNAEAIRRGLQRDDLFTVVHDHFLTDTARYADIILPATTQIEQDDVVAAWGHLWMGWNGKAIEPLGESCSNTELFRRLARAMGYTEPALFEDDATLLAQALGGAVDVDALKASGWVRVPVPRGWSAVRQRPVPDGIWQGRVGQRRPAFDGSTGATDVSASPRRPRRRRPADGRLPPAVDRPEAPHPLPQQQLLTTSQARPRRGRPVRRARPPPMPRPAASPMETPPRCSTIERTSCCPSGQRAGPTRRRRHPVGMVGDAASRRTSGQRVDQRRLDGLGWRGRLLRHARRGARRTSLTSSPAVGQ